MSWNIYLYAEYRDSNNKWHILSDKCFCDNFKFFKTDEYDTFPALKLADLNDNPIKDVLCSTNDDTLDYVNIKYCALDRFVNIYENKIDLFKKRLQIVYKALGLELEIEDSDIYENSCDNEDTINDKLQLSQLFNLMTFPVNKNIVRDITSDFNYAMKAERMLGVADTISNLGYIENCEEIRLLFVYV